MKVITSFKRIKKALTDNFTLDFSIIIAFSFFLLYPILADSNFLRTNDIVGNISNLAYIKQSLFEFKIFPFWNPLLNQGIPIFSDPLNSFLNPLVLFSYLIFPLSFSVKIIYFSSAFLSGVTFYILGKYLRLARLINLILSLTYLSSGYFVSRVFAGHLEKILAYPIIPLVLLSLLLLTKKNELKKNIYYSLMLSTLLLLLLLSGSIYELFYVFILLIVFIIFLLIKHLLHIKNNQKNEMVNTFFIIFSLIIFVLLGSFKLAPIIIGKNFIEHINTPFLGTQNIISILYNFFFPYKEFFERFGLSSLINTNYTWWESFSFIGPLSFMFLIYFFILKIFRKLNESQVGILLVFLLVCLLYAFIGNQWNPFYWIFSLVPFLQQFRIPSRIFIVIIPIILILCGISATQLFQLKNRFIQFLVLMLLSVNLWLVYSTFHTYIKADDTIPYSFVYGVIKPDYPELLKYLRDNDKSFFYIGQSSLFQFQLPSFQAMENGQMILNSTYGYGLKSNKSSLEYTLLDFKSSSKYDGIYPKYLIYPQGIQPPSIFDLIIVKTGNNGSNIYKNSVFTPLAFISPIEELNLPKLSDLDVRIKNIKLKPNEIIVNAISDKNNQKLTIVQSQFPGWNIMIDGKKTEFINNNFLSVKMNEGNHEYVFSYIPASLKIGAIISTLSIVIIILIMFLV